MPQSTDQDTQLIKQVQSILQSCHLDNLILDRKVQINFSGSKGPDEKYEADKEIDVVAKFTYAGKQVLLLFECENSTKAHSLKKEFRAYEADVKRLRRKPGTTRVLKSQDNQLKSHHFKDLGPIGVCFVYGSNFPEPSYKVARREATQRRSFVVWNDLALTYYSRISSTLGGWTKYELFKEFRFDLEDTTTFSIPALELKQKGNTMYLGRIHPGQLLKIAYVVRRASDRTYAYQRMLSRERIAAIREFISSRGTQSFLPNAVIAVFDKDGRVQNAIRYSRAKRQLSIPLFYASAWIIDGQHRAFGFVGTAYEKWRPEKSKPFDLPVILFRKLDEVSQTKSFININYFQKRIQSGLLCDLTTLTRDLRHKLTWPSLIGKELNERDKSPLKGLVKVSELHVGKPVNLASLVQFGLLETLLGYKPRADYSGPLFGYAKFNRNAAFGSQQNKAAFKKHVDLIDRFLVAVKGNTETGNPQTDPWLNWKDFSLLKPTGLNALFLVLAKIMKKHPNAGLDLTQFLNPVQSSLFKRNYVVRKGGGWKGFRALANSMIRKLNQGKSKLDRLTYYGKKEKI